MTRKERLYARIAQADDLGHVHSHYSYAPGDSKGTRHVIAWANGGGEHVYSTREAERALGLLEDVGETEVER
ncbi:MAG: hypothetical protein H0U59_11840 [Gemmatimonadaceae bacterium]|nr:hypothetical protein [Gemmatimonadaceae bacterium]